MRRFLTLAALALLLPAPAARGQESRIEVPHTRFVLPNGLNVILHEDSTIPTVSVNVWYHVGSGRETPGRTGFAHLFAHIMFEGSGHVPEGMFDVWLEAAGGDNNGSTNSDRTNYWENIPSNALELALFLESDRMGWLLDAMSPEKVDGQRDVVKNERRQSYENRPYGMAYLLLGENLYPPEHPYHWPTIGYMEDLTAASYEDVVEFHRDYYGPGNASLSIAGDIDVEEARALVEKWFGEIPAGRPVSPLGRPAAWLGEERRVVHEDRVQLPRVYACWLTPPHLTPGDAELDVLSNVLAGGKNSRLYKRMVYDMQIAQDVSAFQGSSKLSSEFCVVATARAGHSLAELEAVMDEEIARIAAEPPTEREVQRAVNQYEAGFLDRLERVGGFGGKADALNAYYFATGNPDWFNEDLSRYRALDPPDVQAAARTWLTPGGRVVLEVVPQSEEEISAAPTGAGVGR
ncbi:MAG TPA: pitrilysin family protein [Gemmatimonadota bacterium]|nr:pitrilysin family protein [Gemmatimonadota bacterium]